jgi:hypothetical protein
MVNVRLDQDWTDGNGMHHRAGEMVDVDAGTLAQMEQNGSVASGDDLDPTVTLDRHVGPGGPGEGGGGDDGGGDEPPGDGEPDTIGGIAVDRVRHVGPGKTGP